MKKLSIGGRKMYPIFTSYPTTPLVTSFFDTEDTFISLVTVGREYASDSLEAMLNKFHCKSNGSKARPYLVFVDLLYPESNMDLEVTHVTQMKHEGHLCHRFHIQKVLCAVDSKEVKMTVPAKLPKLLRAYVKRVLFD